jgi:hypothetical protein
MPAWPESALRATRVRVAEGVIGFAQTLDQHCALGGAPAVPSTPLTTRTPTELSPAARRRD